MDIVGKVGIEVTSTTRELAKEIWDLSDSEQVELLSYLDDYFFQEPLKGNTQLTYVDEIIEGGFDADETIEKAKHFLSKINEFLIKD